MRLLHSAVHRCSATATKETQRVHHWHASGDLVQPRQQCNAHAGKATFEKIVGIVQKKKGKKKDGGQLEKETITT